ncbi:TetR/AcrR family transcriptional regulator [Cupriavidus basilensis]
MQGKDKPIEAARSQGNKRVARTAPQPAAEPSKRERVLDAAERLFAEGGFEGVSMRDIAAEAGVGLPLIVYHFETKGNLYRALFERRKTLLEARLLALRELVADGEDPVEHIVRALVLPMMRIQETEAGLAYAKLIAREASDPREATRGIVADYFDPFAMESRPGYTQGNAPQWPQLCQLGLLVRDRGTDDERLRQSGRANFRRQSQSRQFAAEERVSGDIYHSGHSRRGTPDVGMPRPSRCVVRPQFLDWRPYCHTKPSSCSRSRIGRLPEWSRTVKPMQPVRRRNQKKI